MAGVAWCFALVSCDEPQSDTGDVDEQSREPIPFALPEKRVRTRIIRPEAYRFLEAITEMEGQIKGLETSLADTQELHEDYDFDQFMATDPASTDKETLFSLAHFCDAGYFTVQRKVMLHLLEQKVARKDNDAWTALNTPGRKDLEQRLAEAMLYREEHIMDLEEVIHLFDTRQGADEFYVPGYVSPEQVEALRAEVISKLEQQRQIAAELDLEIERLSESFELN